MAAQGVSATSGEMSPRKSDHAALCARTVTQIPSSPTATPHGKYRNGIRVASSVLRSIRHRAWSSGTVAQMAPAPAATLVTPAGRVSTRNVT